MPCHFFAFLIVTIKRNLPAELGKNLLTYYCIQYNSCPGSNALLKGLKALLMRFFNNLHNPLIPIYFYLIAVL